MIIMVSSALIGAELQLEGQDDGSGEDVSISYIFI